MMHTVNYRNKTFKTKIVEGNSAMAHKSQPSILIRKNIKFKRIEIIATTKN